MFEILPLLAPLAILGILIFSCAFTVSHQHVAIVERFGKFVRISESGLNFKIPLIEQVAGFMSLRLDQLEVSVETKTLDDVFVRVLTCVQYKIVPTKVYEAFYTLENAEQQIQAFVFDVVRARVPHIKLDDVFAKKDDIANAVRDELQEVMDEFGYDMVKALVTDIEPDARVKAAMNEINEAQRMRIAAAERAEADKVIKIKQAEAESESKVLQGRGIAGQRKAIVDGLKSSVTDFKDAVEDASALNVMTMIMMSQYFDTLKDLGAHGGSSAVLIPHSPSAMQDLYQQITNAIVTADHLNKSPKK